MMALSVKRRQAALGIGTLRGVRKETIIMSNSTNNLVYTRKKEHKPEVKGEVYYPATRYYDLYEAEEDMRTPLRVVAQMVGGIDVIETSWYNLTPVFGRNDWFTAQCGNCDVQSSFGGKNANHVNYYNYCPHCGAKMKGIYKE